MTFLELAGTRRSVRDYAQRSVAREKIERCLEAARLAPSACNSQPWWFIVVDDPEIRAAVAAEVARGPVAINAFAAQAPILVAVVLEASMATARIGGLLKRIPYRLIDLGMAVEHFCLQAGEEGLGTCILGWFNEKGIKKILGIPKTKRISLMLTVGHPGKDEIQEKLRKDRREISSYNRYR